MLLLVLLLPLAGTALGAMMVLFMREGLGGRMGKLLLGASAGVMLAASVWSLLLPAIELGGEGNGPAWLVPALGFFAGILFLYAADVLAERMFPADEKMPAGETESFAPHGTRMLLLAVTVHNLPEGMAVGVAYAGALRAQASVSMAGVLALAVGIAIQNVPEGAIVSMPLRGAGMKKGRAFLWGVMSGVVEPLGGVCTIVLTARVAPFLPHLMSFAAGAMFYVVAGELFPSAGEGEGARIGTLGAAAGFVLMMILDVALGG